MASIHQLPSGRWQVRFRDPARESRGRNFKTKRDATAFANTVEADKLRGRYIDQQRTKTSLGDYAHRWLAIRRHEGARSTHDRDASYLRSMILPSFGDRPVGSIRRADVKEWAAALDRATLTRAKAVQILRRVLELAVDDGAIAANPAAGVRVKGPKPRQGIALSDEQMRHLLNTAEATDPRTATVVWLMVRCGLRIGEVLALRRTDLDGGRLTVRGSMSRSEGVTSPKTEAGERRLVMPADAAERLHRHLAEQPVSNIEGFVFTAPMGGRLRYDNWRTRTWARIAGDVPFDVRPHDLRHTCATRLFTVEQWTPAAVQAYLGHADPRMTLGTYTHIDAGDLPAPSRMAT